MSRKRNVVFVTLLSSAACAAGLALASPASASSTTAAVPSAQRRCETIGVICVTLDRNAVSVLSIGGGATVNPDSAEAGGKPAKPRN